MTLKLETGESLVAFCKRNNAAYSPMRVRITELKMSPEEALKDYRKKKKNRIKYWYDKENKITLYQYCADNELDFNYICNSYRLRGKGKTVKEFLPDIIYKMKNNPNPYSRYPIKHFYKGKPLRYQCEANGWDYNKILSSYKAKLRIGKTSCTIEDIVDDYLLDQRLGIKDNRLFESKLTKQYYKPERVD